MKSLVVVAIVVGVVLGQLNFNNLNFLPGLNLTLADTDFTYRYLAVNKTSLPFNALNVLGWKSVSVDAETASPAAKASGNSMVGVGALPGFANIPFAFLAYGTGEGAVDVDLLSFLGIILSARPHLDANFEAGALGMAALGMQEYDPEGNAVGDFVLFRSPLNSPCAAEDIDGDDGNLKGLSCTFSPAESSAKVTVTYVASKKAGFLDYGHTPVSPRSLEMIIKVDDFPLSDPKNHVSMKFGFFAASGASQLKGTAIVVPNINNEDLYTATSKYGVVDDSSVELQIDFNVGSAELGALADGVLKAVLGVDFDAQIADVNFPAGATSFIYDPVVGVGKNVYEAAEPVEPSSSKKEPTTTGSDSKTSQNSAKEIESKSTAQVESAATSAISILAVLFSIIVFLF